ARPKPRAAPVIRMCSAMGYLERLHSKPRLGCATRVARVIRRPGTMPIAAVRPSCRMSRMLRGVALALGVGCVGFGIACGSDSKEPSSAQKAGAAVTDTDDLEPSPRRAVDGYGYDDEIREQTSDDVRQVGSGAYQSLLDADDRDLRARCGCTFE